MELGAQFLWINADWCKLIGIVNLDSSTRRLVSHPLTHTHRHTHTHIYKHSYTILDSSTRRLISYPLTLHSDKIFDHFSCNHILQLTRHRVVCCSCSDLDECLNDWTVYTHTQSIHFTTIVYVNSSKAFDVVYSHMW